MLLPDPVRFALVLVLANLMLLVGGHLAYLVTGWTFGLAPILSFALASGAAAWLIGRHGARLSRLAVLTACGAGYVVACPITAWFGSVELGGDYGVNVMMLAVLAVLVVPVTALGAAAVNAASWRPRRLG